MLNGELEVRRLIPDFDLLKIDDVLSLDLSFSYQKHGPGKRQSVDMAIEYTYSHQSKVFLIKMLFVDVKELRLPTIGGIGRMFELGEFDIQPKVQKNGDTQYGIEDTLDGLVAQCSDVRFLSISEIRQNNIYSNSP